MRRFVVGTRGSALALWQTRHVTGLLAARAVDVRERVITTKGDTSQAAKLAGPLEKGFFTEELEAALRQREIDWAVHSLKDLPTRPPPGLVLGAVLERAPAGDLLLARPDVLSSEPGCLPLKAGTTVGSSSLRREAMLRHFAPKCVPAPLRGNVPTRVEKLRRGEYGGILLAEAGVRRLGLDLSGLFVFQLNPARWVCAPGQGAVAVQCREDDAAVRALLGQLAHAPTARATGLERDFLRVLEGGCTTPFGCYVDGDVAHLGLATPRGWCTARLNLPAHPAPAWVERQLTALADAPPTPLEDSHDWLTRRV